MKDKGYQVVLTANQTLLSEYGGGIFLGFSSCIPRSVIPKRVYFPLMSPAVGKDLRGGAEVAPNGLRRIEAALLDHGFSEDQVILVHPEDLDQAVGPETKIVGVSDNDPLGLGPASWTFGQLYPGGTHTTASLVEMLSHTSLKRYRPKIILGGPGAWQLESESELDRLGIDHLVIGEGDGIVEELFESLIKGQAVDRIIRGEALAPELIPRLKRPTIHGVVEVSRGCGRGCAFCQPDLQNHRSRMLVHILEDVDLNLKAGRQPLLHAEDILRYRCQGQRIDREEVLRLFRTVADRPGVEMVSVSHAAFSSVLAEPELVAEISDLLDLSPTRWLGPQIGIETASSELMRVHMPGKIRPFSAAKWPEVVLEACRVLDRNHWVPSLTLIIGLPGEKPADVQATIGLVENLRWFKSLIVPLFFVAQGRLAGRTRSFRVEDLTGLHGELIRKSWDHNLAWSLELFREYADMFIGNRFRRSGLKLATRFLTRAIVKGFDRKLDRILKDKTSGSPADPAVAEWGGRPGLAGGSQPDI